MSSPQITRMFGFPSGIVRRLPLLVIELFAATDWATRSCRHCDGPSSPDWGEMQR